MAKMTEEDYQELVALLDGRIDELTKPIPSQQILRFAEAIRSADVGDDQDEISYGPDDYENLLEAQGIVEELLPDILENIRARSIDASTGWQFVKVDAGNGDHGLCAVCKKPYQHFEWTVKVHCLDMREGRYHGVCRECVGNYAPEEFVEDDQVNQWFQANRRITSKVENDRKREGQRIALVDAVRLHAESQGKTYADDILKGAPEWVRTASLEWR